MKIVIVGGVAGGATAAARLRRLDERAEIVVFERSGYISYANCGLPYYIGGTIEDAEELILQTPDSLWSRFRIDVRIHQEVTAINVGKKTVTVRELDTDKTYEESYDKLILSPGAKPILVRGCREWTVRMFLRSVPWRILFGFMRRLAGRSQKQPLWSEEVLSA